MKDERTLREKILAVWARRPPGMLYTASEIARMTGGKLSSVSSMLVKMWYYGDLRRQPNVGPRGGCGYHRSSA